MVKPFKPLWFFLIVRPLVAIVLGINVRHREKLPKHGPAIVVANHNSHLDTLALMSLFSWSELKKVRPVAAADYWLSNRLLSWFANEVIDIVPISRAPSRHDDPFSGIEAALKNGDILILFPEGTRGEPEKLNHFKSGIARIAESSPDVPITPVFMHGLGKSLPRGEGILVPFFCDLFVGDSMLWFGTRHEFLESLEGKIHELASEEIFPEWE